jgi:hypothetical protein
VAARSEGAAGLLLVLEDGVVHVLCAAVEAHGGC